MEKKIIRQIEKNSSEMIEGIKKKGEWGVATNIEGFSFAVATEGQEPIVYLTKNVDGKCVHEVASQEWLDNYMKTRTAPLEEK